MIVIPHIYCLQIRKFNVKEGINNQIICRKFSFFSVSSKITELRFKKVLKLFRPYRRVCKNIIQIQVNLKSNF